MEQSDVAVQSTALHQQSLLPVRVSDGAFFHVRYRGEVVTRPKARSLPTPTLVCSPY